MTPEQAAKIHAAVIECRHTSRQLMLADGGKELLQATAADDEAYANACRLISDATKH